MRSSCYWLIAYLGNINLNIQKNVSPDTTRVQSERSDVHSELKGEKRVACARKLDMHYVASRGVILKVSDFLKFADWLKPDQPMRPR